MQASKNIQVVKAAHIQPGIDKYGGVIDQNLQDLLTKAGYEYTPYQFKDKRILLILPHNTAALLYPSKEVLFQKLDLTPKSIH